MQVKERREEIMRILVSKRKVTVSELSEVLCVSARTIKRDIAILMLEYPIYQISGIGGGLAVADWYHPYRKVLSKEQFQTLEELKGQIPDERKRKVIDSLLSEYASNYYRD